MFKEGVLEVPRIDSDNVMHGVTIVARDKAGNSTSKLVNITVSSMRGKYSPTAIAQEVDNGHVPDPETSVNKNRVTRRNNCNMEDKARCQHTRQSSRSSLSSLSRWNGR